MASRKKSKAVFDMSFFDHLEELRKRFIYIAILVIIATVISFSYADQLLAFLTGQADNLDLIYTTPAEAFMSQIRLAFIAGVIITLPFSLYHLLAFIMPALRKAEKKAVILLVFFMVFLFFLGVSFAYYIVFPYALKFFLGFAREGLIPLFTISRYISFVVSFLVGFGVVFQIPLIFWFLGRFSIVSSTFLRTNRKYALLIIAILSAIITPPDIFSQVLMIVPLMFLYEIGVLLVRLTERKRAKMEQADDA
ncbi:MAG: twin-arginine translocase subunit TatC [Bacillota bacterium]|nr:twin-arginine translocase subunit TatC [Bacillota bacterium]